MLKLACASVNSLVAVYTCLIYPPSPPWSTHRLVHAVDAWSMQKTGPSKDLVSWSSATLERVFMGFASNKMCSMYSEFGARIGGVKPLETMKIEHENLGVAPAGHIAV